MGNPTESDRLSPTAPPVHALDDPNSTLFSRAVSALDIGVVITDATRGGHPIVFCNDAFVRMSGDPRGEILNGSCRFLAAGGSEDQGEKVRAALDAGRACRVELLCVRRDGSSFWNEIAFSPLPDESGRVTHFMAIHTDVTRRKMQEARHKRQRKEQMDALRLSVLNELSAGLAHELNQPLTAISTYAEAVLDSGCTQPPDGRSRQRMLVGLRDAVFRASRIIKKMRRVHGEKIPQRRAVALNAVVRDVLAELEQQHEEGGIVVRLDLEEDLPIVVADSGRVQLVVFNLLTNAARATGEAPPDRREIRVRTRRFESTVEVAVEDSRVGLASDDTERVFDWSSSTGDDPSMSLAMCRSIAEVHGGTIRAERSERGGAVFRLALPLPTAEK